MLGLEIILQSIEPLDPGKSRAALVEAVRELLLHDFQKLLWVLYRVDVSEPKLKALLAANPDADAAEIIADELLKRQVEKIKTRETFKRDQNIPPSEQW